MAYVMITPSTEVPSIYEAIVISRNMFRFKNKELNVQKRKEYVDSIANYWRRSANSNTDIRAGLPLF